MIRRSVLFLFWRKDFERENQTKRRQVVHLWPVVPTAANRTLRNASWRFAIQDKSSFMSIQKVQWNSMKCHNSEDTIVHNDNCVVTTKLENCSSKTWMNSFTNAFSNLSSIRMPRIMNKLLYERMSRECQTESVLKWILWMKWAEAFCRWLNILQFFGLHQWPNNELHEELCVFPELVQ
jgi:hypothetical protein